MEKSRCEACKILSFQALFHKEDREALHDIVFLGIPKSISAAGAGGIEGKTRYG